MSKFVGQRWNRKNDSPFDSLGVPLKNGRRLDEIDVVFLETLLFRQSLNIANALDGIVSGTFGFHLQQFCYVL